MKNLSLILTLALVLIHALVPHESALTWGLSRPNLENTMMVRLTYNFLHAGWMHLAINMYCMLTIAFLMHARVWQFLTALAIASTIPTAMIGGIPILGMSAVNFALCGILMARNRRWPLILILNVIFILATSRIAAIAYSVHLYTMCAGVLIGYMTNPQFDE